jgi:hypothetical protein
MSRDTYPDSAVRLTVRQARPGQPADEDVRGYAVDSV